MKKKLKIISVFLLTIALGINTLNVIAYDPDDDSVCGEGEILHTNYYMFLDVANRETLMGSAFTNNGTKNWNHYTGAPKYNNIHSTIVPGGNIIAQNNLRITNGSQATLTNSSSIEWTAAEYWQHFYAGMVDIRTGEKSKNKIYDEDIRTTYLFHNGNWWSYQDEAQDNNAGTSHTDNQLSNNKLYSYLANNISNIATSTIVTKGTALPLTNITPTNLQASFEGTSYFFRVNRTYTPESLTDIPGFTLGSSTDRIYAPAAYYVQYCIKKGEKTIEYDQNYEGEPAENMPSNQKFNALCTNISDKIPEREGYEFLGWNTDKDASKPSMIAGSDEYKYAPGEQYCGNSIKLYAIWKEKGADEPEDKPFTVTYDANKGTDAPAPQEGNANDNTCVKISDQGKMTLAKNKFLGWSTKEDAAEPDKKYAPGTEYCGEEGDLTLYAIWNAATGVSAHVIAFGIVAMTAGVALVVAKKKNLFKQI